MVQVICTYQSLQRRIQNTVEYLCMMELFCEQKRSIVGVLGVRLSSKYASVVHQDDTCLHVIANIDFARIFKRLLKTYLGLRQISIKNLFCQKQPPEVFYEKRCSRKFHKIHRKTPVPVSFLIKMQVSGLEKDG